MTQCRYSTQSSLEAPRLEECSCVICEGTQVFLNQAVGPFFGTFHSLIKHGGAVKYGAVLCGMSVWHWQAFVCGVHSARVQLLILQAYALIHVGQNRVLESRAHTRTHIKQPRLIPQTNQPNALHSMIMSQMATLYPTFTVQKIRLPFGTQVCFSDHQSAGRGPSYLSH